jgi:hypothetical protein
MPQRKRAAIRYPRELTEPVPPADLDDENAFVRTLAIKLAALAKFHQVDLDAPGVGLRLALALAITHVPGFKLRAPPGPRRTWQNGLGEALRIDVTDTMKRLNCGVGKAIAYLHADDKTPWSKHPIVTLAARYRDASRRYRAASPRERLALVMLTRNFRPASSANSD